MGESIGRPWLYPYNRRLRHLKAIDLRYLTRPYLPNRSRATSSVDDEGLPSSTQSPVKLLAQKELNALGQTRSSTDLTLHAISEHVTKDNDQPTLQTPSRPKRLRRRSTIDWANSSPSVRQKRLEDDAKANLMDVFYSLHVHGEHDPIYVSELCTRTINPTFGLFDLSDQPSHISRQDMVTVKVWIRETDSTSFTLHIDVTMNLKNLHYLCKTAKGLTMPLPKNCILFTLTDGIYTTPNAVKDNFIDQDISVSISTSTSTRVFPTSSYDALMRMSTLDAIIQDAIVAKSNIVTELDTILESRSHDDDTILSVDPQFLRVQAAHDALEASKKNLERLIKRRDNAQNLLVSHRNFLEMDQERQKQGQKEMDELSGTVSAQKQQLALLENEKIAQRRRICETLQSIYPILPLPSGPALSFTIAGLALPNAMDLNDGDDATMAAALGHVAQILTLLSAYLEKPLPYPVEPKGSSSTVTDQLSASTGATIYPLFSKGVARFRFEYAVFLVNKDIEILCAHVGLKLVDARHTLANLKYLLYIASAGTGELPARKAGGMRAFLKSSGAGGSVESSRRGSDASSVGTSSAVKGKERNGEDGKLNGLVTPLPLPFRNTSGFKSSGLRVQTK